jgi:lysophospholipase L1-like esterase
MARILVFGDSIVWGADDLEFGGWVNRFKIWFKGTGKFNEVFNLGNPGEDSNQLLKRIENECKIRLKPEHRTANVVIIQIGMNDSQYLFDKKIFRTSLKKFQINIQELIKISKKFVSKVIFVGLSPVEEVKVTPIPWAKNEFCKNEYVQKYNEIIKSVCRENNIYFVEIFDEWIKSDYKELLDDGLHPNSEGHKKIFETVKDFLIQNKII